MEYGVYLKGCSDPMKRLKSKSLKYNLTYLKCFCVVVNVIETFVNSSPSGSELEFRCQSEVILERFRLRIRDSENQEKWKTFKSIFQKPNRNVYDEKEKSSSKKLVFINSTKPGEFHSLRIGVFKGGEEIEISMVFVLASGAPVTTINTHFCELPPPKGFHGSEGCIISVKSLSSEPLSNVYFHTQQKERVEFERKPSEATWIRRFDKNLLQNPMRVFVDYTRTNTLGNLLLSPTKNEDNEHPAILTLTPDLKEGKDAKKVVYIVIEESALSTIALDFLFGVIFHLDDYSKRPDTSSKNLYFNIIFCKDEERRIYFAFSEHVRCEGGFSNTNETRIINFFKQLTTQTSPSSIVSVNIPPVVEESPYLPVKNSLVSALFRMDLSKTMKSKKYSPGDDDDSDELFFLFSSGRYGDVIEDTRSHHQVITFYNSELIPSKKNVRMYNFDLVTNRRFQNVYTKSVYGLLASLTGGKHVEVQQILKKGQEAIREVTQIFGMIIHTQLFKSTLKNMKVGVSGKKNIHHHEIPGSLNNEDIKVDFLYIPNLPEKGKDMEVRFEYRGNANMLKELDYEILDGELEYLVPSLVEKKKKEDNTKKKKDQKVKIPKNGVLFLEEKGEELESCPLLVFGNCEVCRAGNSHIVCRDCLVAYYCCETHQQNDYQRHYSQSCNSETKEKKLLGYYHEGVNFLQNKKFLDAVGCFDRICRLSPLSVKDCLFRRSEAYEGLSMYSNSISDLDYIISNSKSKNEIGLAYYRKGLVLKKMGQTGKKNDEESDRVIFSLLLSPGHASKERLKQLREKKYDKEILSDACEQFRKSLETLGVQHQVSGEIVDKLLENLKILDQKEKEEDIIQLLNLWIGRAGSSVKNDMKYIQMRADLYSEKKRNHGKALKDYQKILDLQDVGKDIQKKAILGRAQIFETDPKRYYQAYEEYLRYMEVTGREEAWVLGRIGKLYWKKIKSNDSAELFLRMSVECIVKGGNVESKDYQHLCTLGSFFYSVRKFQWSERLFRLSMDWISGKTPSYVGEDGKRKFNIGELEEVDMFKTYHEMIPFLNETEPDTKYYEREAKRVEELRTLLSGRRNKNLFDSDDLVINERIGEGYFGRVYSVIGKLLRKVTDPRTFDHSGIIMKVVEGVEEERIRRILKKDSLILPYHKNVVPILYSQVVEDMDMKIFPDYDEYWKGGEDEDEDEGEVEEEEFCAIVFMRHHRKSLRSYLKEREAAACVPFTFEICGIMNGVIQGIKHLHDHFVVHRDLHSDNIFVEEVFGRALVGDFGCSLDLRTNNHHENKFQVHKSEQRFMYSLTYYGENLERRKEGGMHSAPEVAYFDEEKEEYYDYEKYDVFSCGVILYRLLSFFATGMQKEPFRCPPKGQRTQSNYVKLEIPEVSDLCRFADSLLKVEKKERMSIDQAVVEIEKLSETYELLKSKIDDGDLDIDFGSFGERKKDGGEEEIVYEPLSLNDMLGAFF